MKKKFKSIVAVRACIFFVLVLMPFHSHSQTNNVLTGTWSLMEFKNILTGEVTDTTEIQNGVMAAYNHVRLEFKDSVGVGTFRGMSFCNGVGGSYSLSGKNLIKASDMIGTMIGCLYEGKFDDAFRTLSSYKREGDTLYLLYNNNTEEMVFVKKD